MEQISNNELPKWSDQVSKDYQNGFYDGQHYAEIQMFRCGEYKLLDKDFPGNCSEIWFKPYGQDTVVFTRLRKGYWETPENDGTPVHVCICSECHKPSKLPRTRYCPNCGSLNADSGV